MSLEYAESRIRKALELTKGNPTRARQQIIAWTYEDPKLLHALARPHLTGIVAYAVNRVIHRDKLGKNQEEAPQNRQNLDMAPDAFGQQLLSALQSGNTPQFGRESSAPPISRKLASQEHIEAMRRLARKQDKDR